jgi:hypothetical protein
MWGGLFQSYLTYAKNSSGVLFPSALVLELVDRHDSGSCVRKGVEVQVLSRALVGLVK